MTHTKWAFFRAMAGFSSVALVLALAACGSVPKVVPYVPLAGGPTATLTVVNEGLDQQFDFSAVAYPRTADCSSSQMFALVSEVLAQRAKGTRHTTVIDADVPISLSMMSMRSVSVAPVVSGGAMQATVSASTNHCSTGAVAFTPVAGGRYKATFRDDGRRCDFTLVRLEAGGQETPLPTVFKTIQTDFVSGKRSCT